MEIAFDIILCRTFLLKQYILMGYFFIIAMAERPGGSETPSLSGLSNNRMSVRDQILDTMFKNYKKHERPTERWGNATEVMVYMKVLAINSVEVRNMEYSTDLYLRQQWYDTRLAWHTLPKFKNHTVNIVSPILKDKIWLPDLFFRNGKEGYLHNMTLPNYLMRVTPQGNVLYSQKITMRFSCQMDLKTFPMDEQQCEMDIGSYGYTLDQLKFVWRWDAIVLGKELDIPEFKKPSNVTVFDCTQNSKTSTGQYTCLKAIFHLKRQLGSYLASTYVPNVLIITVSWLNFWVSIDAVPARITLGLLTLLGILTQASAVSASLPRISYVKAIDIWTMTCILFVVAALVEFAVASTMSKRQKSNLWHKEVRSIVRQELAHWCAACQQQQLQYNSMLNTAASMNSTSSNLGVMSGMDGLGGIYGGMNVDGMQSIGSVGGGIHAMGGMGSMPGIPMIPMSGPGSGGTSRRQYPRNLMGNEISDELETVLTYQLLEDKKEPSYSHNHYGTAAVAAAAAGISGTSTAGGAGLPETRTGSGPNPAMDGESDVDAYSRFLFPACFILYNCFYWLYYLILVHHNEDPTGKKVD